MTPAAITQRNRVIVIVGGAGGTNVGESLRGAAAGMNRQVRLLNAAEAMSRNRLLQAIFWHACGRRPVHLNSFSRGVEAACPAERGHLLIATGAAPLTVQTLRHLKTRDVISVNYSTDDPFNPSMRAPWHLDALPAYDVVFTPRRANVEDLTALGCSDVRYLPFGYDEALFAPPSAEDLVGASEHDILFVGGADRDRAEFVKAFMRGGLKPTLVGSYWDRFTATRGLSIGQRTATELLALTARAKVNLCLVRRANRDGHVMRSFEIPACGGFMIAEDTAEHREIFGEEGRCVLYFSSPESAAEKAAWALANVAERRRMAVAANERITSGANTYRDRLQHMLLTKAP